MVVRFQNRFCFLSSPIISGEGKILPPLNQKGPPLGWKIRKIVGLLILIAQKKGFDALNATQKTSALCKVPFMKKKEAKMVKNGKNGKKMTVFASFSCFFQKCYFAES